MQNRDTIEFYDGDKLLCSANSSMVPAEARRISIRGKTWIVLRVTYALDHADELNERGMRANVDLEAC